MNPHGRAGDGAGRPTVLAIGKKGQNARLAAKLTGWKIDINRLEKPADETNFEDKVHRAIEALARIPGIGPETAAKLINHGFSTLEGILAPNRKILPRSMDFDPNEPRKYWRCPSANGRMMLPGTAPCAGV